MWCCSTRRSHLRTLGKYITIRTRTRARVRIRTSTEYHRLTGSLIAKYLHRCCRPQAPMRPGRFALRIVISMAGFKGEFLSILTVVVMENADI